MDSSDEMSTKNYNSHNSMHYIDHINTQLDPNWESYNQLNQAIRYGQKEIIKFYIKDGVCINRNPLVQYICTPLHLAVNLGCPEIIRLLLDKGALLNVANNNHETPLMVAAKTGKNEIVDILLSENCQKNCSNRENFSHMHIACMRNRVDVVKKLVQNGARINHAIKNDSNYYPGYTPLHFAVQFQSIQVVEFLLNSGADITEKDARQFTPLHIADLIRNEAIIDMILSAHKSEIGNPVDSEGLSHFHIACTRNNTAVVKSFITHGIDINAKVYGSSMNWPGYRALNFAIEYECTDVVKLLLKYNVHWELNDMINNPLLHAYKTANKLIINSLLSKSSFDKTAVPRRNLSQFHRLEVIMQDLIEDLNWSTWTGYTPLHLAIKHDYVTISKSLLKHSAYITIKDVKGKTPLHLAFERKQIEIVDLILKNHFSVKENPVNNDGLSHFHIACMRKKTRMVKFFVQNGVDINSSVNIDSVFWPGYTSLHFAAEFQQTQMVRQLLKHGADFTIKNASGLTPLDIAINSLDSRKLYWDELEDSLNIIRLFLSAIYTNPTRICDDHGFSHLHIFCMRNDPVAIENYLTLHPGKINTFIDWPSSDWYKYTALHFAAHFGNPEAIDVLIKRGADVTVKNGEGNTALHMIFFSRFLLREIENPELFHVKENPIGDEGYSHFHIACNTGNLEAVKYFISQGVDVNLPIKFTGVYNEYTGQKPLHFAVSKDEISEELVNLLIENGADVNGRDMELNTPLHCTKFQVELGVNIAKTLLKHGADVNARNISNETPLFSICREWSSFDSDILLKRIRFLLNNGADINIENEECSSVFTYIETKLPNVIKVKCIALLMKHMKRLRMINCYISEKNRQDYMKLVEEYKELGHYKEADFAEKCSRELEQMVNIYLDSYTSLRDILFKNLNEMALHSQNIALQEVISSIDFHKKFPIYGYLVESQFQKGLLRRPLLQNSRDNLNILIKFQLPGECSEKILEYLSNEDLKNIISSLE